MTISPPGKRYPVARPEDLSRDSTVRHAHALLRSLMREELDDAESEHLLVEDALRRTLASGRNSVRGALNQLALEGRVVRQPRSGTRINDRVMSLQVGGVTTPVEDEMKVRRLGEGVFSASDVVRRRLNLDCDRVGYVEHLYIVNKEPIGVRIAYYDEEFTPTASIESRRGKRMPADRIRVAMPFDVAFEIVFGCALGRVTSTLELGLADAATAKLLNVEAGAPVLTREVLAEDVFGIPRELSYTYYRADRVSFTTTEGPLVD